MKSFRSSLLRPWGSLVHGLGVVSLIVAAWFGFLRLVVHAADRRSLRFPWDSFLQEPEFLVPAALAAVVGLWIVLYKFGANRGRYRAGATELEIRSGLIWQRTRFLRYSDITSIELSDGPLMRLLGTADLVIVASSMPHRAVLHGVSAGEEVRRFLLQRKESLRELAADEG